MRCIFFIVMKKVINVCFLSILLFVGCSQKGKLVQDQDYLLLIQQKEPEKNAKADTESDILFWTERLQRDTGNYIDQMQLANCWNRLFQLTGEINYLQRADSLLNHVFIFLGKDDPEFLVLLSQQAITCHRFNQASWLLDQARVTGGAGHLVNLVSFDTQMELGQFKEANTSLNRIADKGSFDYLIRRSRWEDHRGNGEGAIEWMERAVSWAKERDLTALHLWGLSNLSDMYLHNGFPKKAVEGYKAVLRQDRNYVHALRGLAWIAFSHDKNPEAAESILQYLQDQYKMPELYLERAEIKEWKGEHDSAQLFRSAFVRKVDDSFQRPMYAKYLIECFTEDSAMLNRALDMALNERKNRATPETASWLAWCYFKKKNTREAVDLLKSQVEGMTFEPDVLLQMAMIYAEYGQQQKAKAILAQCNGAEWEWGPLKQAEWEKLNKRL